ncbi:MAG: hypothetical protein DBP00_07280 [gamma proteobacterium symbiont of Ctena orbiculata]|nr:MAG: hypothetical protein DBP00_07280 [gamma proteobacterium symbiont of Ctena orbiculata]
MKGNINPSFEDFPKTRQIIDREGRIGFVITPRILTPVRAMVADGTAVALTVGLAANNLFFHESHYLTQDWQHIALLAAPVAAYPLLKLTLPWLFKTRTQIILTPSQISFKRGGRTRAYDRTKPHSYSVIEHDKTRREQERHELAVRRAQAEGEIIAKKKYFGDSFHICFNPIGQRKDILTVTGKKAALAILMRLKACDEIIEAYAGLGEGLALTPEPEWKPQPGDLRVGGLP